LSDQYRSMGKGDVYDSRGEYLDDDELHSGFDRSEYAFFVDPMSLKN